MREPDFLPPIDMREPEQPPWSLWDVMMILLMTVGAYIFSGFVLILLMHAGKLSRTVLSSARVAIAVQTGIYGIVLAFMVLLAHLYGRRFLGAVNWRWPGQAWPDWRARLLASIAACAAGGVVLAFAIGVAQRFVPMPARTPFESLLRDPTSAYLMTAFGVTVAPFVEEIFFRGILYPVLARAGGVSFGIVITAAAFASVHLPQYGLGIGPGIMIFLVGLVLTIARARTKSIVPGFVIHVFYNGTLFFLLWMATDHFRHLEKAMQ
jgi:hypothetical protein